jgi:hypothetical protein
LLLQENLFHILVVSQKVLTMFPITPTFYPICLAPSSTPFNINYNPRVHIYFYFAARATKRCFRWGVLPIPKKIVNGPVNMPIHMIWALRSQGRGLGAIWPPKRVRREGLFSRSGGCFCWFFSLFVTFCYFFYCL